MSKQPRQEVKMRWMWSAVVFAGVSLLRQLWPREMVTGVYDPKWLRCHLGLKVGLKSAWTF